MCVFLKTWENFTSPLSFLKRPAWQTFGRVCQTLVVGVCQPTGGMAFCNQDLHVTVEGSNQKSGDDNQLRLVAYPHYIPLFAGFYTSQRYDTSENDSFRTSPWLPLLWLHIAERKSPISGIDLKWSTANDYTRNIDPMPQTLKSNCWASLSRYAAAYLQTARWKNQY